MTDGNDKLPGDFVVVNAVDHATTAEGETHAGIILGAARQRIAELQITILVEDQTVDGSFGHVALYPSFQGMDI